jgi:uncharacterized protein YciI
MKFFIIEGTFKDPIPVSSEDLKKTISEHLVFLQKGFEEGWILVSGPKADTGGGVIVAKAQRVEDLKEYFSKDPLLTTGVQDYRFIEFRLHECQDITTGWFA